MKFGIFYELQLPRPWHENSEYQLMQDALEQIVARNGRWPPPPDRRRRPEHPIHEPVAVPNEFALGEWPEVDEIDPPGQRLGQLGNGEETSRPRQQELAGAIVIVHASLDGEQEVVTAALSLVDYEEAVALDELGRILPDEFAYDAIIQRLVVRIKLRCDLTDECRLSRLAGASEEDHS